MLLLSFSYECILFLVICFFFNDPATTYIYTLSLHDALPISVVLTDSSTQELLPAAHRGLALDIRVSGEGRPEDRKSTRLNSSHLGISYAVFCLKKKK